MNVFVTEKRSLFTLTSPNNSSFEQTAQHLHPGKVSSIDVHYLIPLYRPYQDFCKVGYPNLPSVLCANLPNFLSGMLPYDDCSPQKSHRHQFQQAEPRNHNRLK